MTFYKLYFLGGKQEVCGVTAFECGDHRYTAHDDDDDDDGDDHDDVVVVVVVAVVVVGINITLIQLAGASPTSGSVTATKTVSVATTRVTLFVTPQGGVDRLCLKISSSGLKWF